jgi:hypothetical protein
MLLKSPHTWHMKWAVNKEDKELFYVSTTIYLGIINGKPKYTTLNLQDFLLGLLDGQGHGDHINHIRLDNRKDNLRIISHSNNNRNRKSKNSNNSSGYRNVCWNKRDNNWIVQIQVEGKSKRLGKFDNVDEAGEFAEKMRQKYYGKYKGLD